MADFHRLAGSYDAICDLYFDDDEQRAEHIISSNAHPRCPTCEKAFLNHNRLRMHFKVARGHHYCDMCERSFSTPAGYLYHMEHSPRHQEENYDMYTGEYVGPVEGSSSRSSSRSSSSHHCCVPSSSSSSADSGYEDDREDMYPKENEHRTERRQSDIVQQVVPENERTNRSWEDFDDYDFESLEEVGDPPLGDCGCEEEHSDSVDFEDTFSCPLCEKQRDLVCVTHCGHLFCAPCIRDAYKFTSACPICEEAGTFDDVRRVYLAACA